jgi:hypothetical protein
VLVDQIRDDLFVEPDDLFRRAAAVRDAGGVGQINDILVRELP